MGLLDGLLITRTFSFVMVSFVCFLSWLDVQE